MSCFGSAYTWPAFNFVLTCHTDYTLSLIFTYLAGFTMSHDGMHAMVNKEVVDVQNGQKVHIF